MSWWYIIYPSPEYLISNSINPISDIFLNIIIFFVLFLIYFEIGLKALSFDLMVTKITQNRTYDNDDLLKGFNKVFNKYVVNMIVFVLLSFLISYILFQTNYLSEFSGNLGLKMGAMESIILFTILAIAGPLIIWFYFSNEEEKINPISFFFSRKKSDAEEKEPNNLD